MNKEFAFDKKEHIYTLDGKPLTGVTTVLKVIAKPALIQWAANEAVKYIKENCTPVYITEDNPIYEGVYEEVLEEARLAHRKKKKEAGEKGTDVHAYIEAFITSAINIGQGFISPRAHSKAEGVKFEPNNVSELAKIQVQKFCDWALDKNVRFLSCEQQVYSEKHWIAGTYDFIAEIDGKKFVGDIKTSNAIYGREYFAQTAAYRLMLEEKGETGFTGSVVVRLGKDGSSEVMFSEDYQEDKKLFLACLDVYRSMGTFGTEEVKQ